VHVDLADAETQARELIAWADGYEETNEANARRVRAFCRNTLDLIDELQAERGARVAMQGNYRRCLDVLSSRIYAAATEPNGDNNLDDGF
jgi:hypothetical protein